MAEVESVLSSSLCDMAYHLALPQVRKRNIYETLWLLCILRYRSRSGSSVGDPSPLVLTLLAVDLSLPPLGLSSFRFIILYGSSRMIYVHDYRFPLFPFPWLLSLPL